MYKVNTFLIRIPKWHLTCIPTLLTISWVEGKSQSSEKAAACPGANLVSKSSWMSPDYRKVKSIRRNLLHHYRLDRITSVLIYVTY